MSRDTEAVVAARAYLARRSKLYRNSGLVLPFDRLSLDSQKTILACMRSALQAARKFRAAKRNGRKAR